MRWDTLPIWIEFFLLFWFCCFVWQRQNKISQEADSEPLYANIPASGPNNSSESPVTTNTLLKSQNGWLLDFQKSGPNSPPLPESMPPPSWGAQGTRDVSLSFSVFLSASKINWKGVEGSQLPDNPGLTRNNHWPAKLGRHICKRWTGHISSPATFIFFLHWNVARFKSKCRILISDWHF